MIGVNRRRVMGGGGESYTALSYVQDGLIGQYDGIENAGVGVHGSPEQWKDLVGDNDLLLENITWGDDGAIYNGSDSVAYLSSKPFSDSFQSVEICATMTGNNNWMTFQFSTACYMGYNGNGRLIVVTKGTGDNDYYHTAFTPTSAHTASALPNMELAVDGVILSTSNVNTNGVLSSTKYQTLFGARYNGRISMVLTGKIHSIRIYDKRLSQEELTKNYNIDMKRFG